MKTLERDWTFEEALDHFQVGADWLYKRLQSGEIEGYKLGGKWRIPTRAIQKFKDRCPSNKKVIKPQRQQTG